MVRLLGVVMVTVVSVSVAGAEARAQGAFPPASFTNLTVLPKDSSAATVVAMMKTFTRALGVRCQHCHVGGEGLPLEQFDFAADTKPAKATARVMMKLVAEVNTTLDRELPAGGKPGRVSCMTCHAGRPTPQAQ